jgi:hypothetical protein
MGQGGTVRSTSRLAAIVAIVALTVGVLATGALAQSDTVTFRGQINSLNDSAASANATATLDESTNQLDVRINGQGFAAAPHAQHIHGVQSGQSTCPTVGQVDEDGDGFASTPEGQTTYGPIQASLTTEGDTSPDSALAVERFPTYETGTYSRTIQLSQDVASELDRLHIVMHGNDVNGNGEYDAGDIGMSPLNEELPFEATMPAACGTLTAQAAGGVQTGAGGTAETGAGMTPMALLAAGGLAVGGFGFGLRRTVKR